MSNQEYQLTVRKGPKVGQVFYLDARSLIIGRDPMSDIIINDPEVSRQHARITQTEDGFQIEDLGSTNGTFVEGRRLKSEAVDLQPGQAIGMGSGVRLVYDIVSERSSHVETLIDPGQPWPNEEADTPERLDTNPADTFEDELPESNFSSPFNEPELYDYSEPDSDPPLVPPGENNNNQRRNAIIAVAAIILLCCCCSLIGFMYQWGGDMLFEYFGLY